MNRGLFGVYQNGNFYWEKAFHTEKKWENDYTPFLLYATE